MEKKTLALTFDDGPSADIMPKVLNLLKQYDAHATFFIWGEKITPELVSLVRSAHEQGNEIANHSVHHLHMSQLTAQEVRDEVLPLQAQLEQITGVAPVLFRPPYLDISPTMEEVIPLPMITGSSNKDWTPLTDLLTRIRLAQEAAADGAILLMHCFENNDATVEALKVLLPWFQEQGFQVTTVSNLFVQKGIQPQAGKVYNAADVL